ncbi:MAG: magnesium chelatase domain-containing protein [Limisphaerales bacterium]
MQEAAQPEGTSHACSFEAGAPGRQPCGASRAWIPEKSLNPGQVWGESTLVIVGLPDAAVKEPRDRVMTALINSGFEFTFGRTTISVASADVKKEGPSFDLPIPFRTSRALRQVLQKCSTWYKF